MSGIKAQWDQARLVLRYAGVSALLGLGARKLLRPMVSWKTLCFFERDLSLPDPEVRARIPIETRIATRKDLERFREVLAQGGVPWRQVEDLVARGDLCFLGIAEGRLIHFLWVALRPIRDPEIGVTIVLGPGEAYASSSYTDTSARGHRVQPSVAKFMIDYAHSQGFQRLFYHVERNNYSGLKIAAAACAAGKTKPRRTVRFFRLAGLTSVLATGLDSPGIPKLELPADALLRRLGRFGVWVPRLPAQPPSP